MRPYNPLDKNNLADSIVRRLLEQPPSALPPPRFVGVGIYAIYYAGPFELYERVAIQNADGKFDRPIYVGKAVAKGARVGGLSVGFDEAQGTSLYARLAEHGESIDQVVNLNRDDFWSRYLVVDEIWIPLAESLLITRFRPIWNPVIKGFGNHDPGKGRTNQQPSPWDTLHPGRPWAARLRGAVRDREIIELAAHRFMTKNDYPPSRALAVDNPILNSDDIARAERALASLQAVDDEDSPMDTDD